jgi:lysozyme
MPAMNRRRFLKSTALGAAGFGGIAATKSLVQADGTSYAIQGIDISKWQGTINWKAFNGTPYKFAFCKATEGTTYTDPNFSVNYRGIKSAGLIRGAYHYGRPATDPVTQANFFVNTVKPIKGDLQLVLDLETADGKTATQVRAWTVAFCNQIQSRTGRPAIIYTGFYFWRDMAGNGSNLNCPLWLAAYVANPTTPTNLIPAAWGTWSFWQYTDASTVSGISGGVDADCFNGTLAGLNALTLP